MGLFDSLAGAGISAATGNLLGAGIDLAGIGIGLLGGMSASKEAEKANQIEGQISGLEGQVNQQHYQAMMLSSQRENLQTLRTNQQLRAQAMSAATNQNAQFGSGLQGGLGQITNEGLFNLQGVNQNTQIGQNIFGFDQQISQDKLQLSQIQGNQATDMGIASLGGSIAKMGDPLSKLLQGFNLSSFGGGAGTTMGLNGLPAIG